MRRQYIGINELVTKFDHISDAELMDTIKHKIGKMAVMPSAYDNVVVQTLSYDKHVGTMKYEELYITHDALEQLANGCKGDGNTFEFYSGDIHILESVYIL